MKLVELFDKSVPWQEAFHASYQSEYEFTVDGVGEYYVAITIDTDSGEGVWTLEFTRKRDDNHWSHDMMDAGGKQLQVFSTVLDIVRHFIRKRQGEVDYINFTASEPSRIKLYRRMAQRLGSSYVENAKSYGNEFIVKV